MSALLETGQYSNQTTAQPDNAGTMRINSSIEAIARYTLLEAVRNRLLWLTLAAISLTMIMAVFLAQVALTEAAEFRAALLGACLRLEAVVLVSLFVITSFAREINDKGFEMLLSLPISRADLLLGKLLGFAGLALVIAALFGLALSFTAPLGQVFIWTVSLALELLMVTILSVLFSLTFAQIPAAMAGVLAFYALARTMAALQLMGKGPMQINEGLVHDVMVSVLDGLAYMLPSLHEFTRTEWLVYHTAQWRDLPTLLGQGAVYLGLLTAAALIDLYRKNL